MSGSFNGIVLYAILSLTDQAFAGMCAPFDARNNGFLTYSPSLLYPAVPEGTTSVLTCHFNHIAVGPVMSVCMANSRWSKKLGECQSIESGESCLPIQNFNGTIIYTPHAKPSNGKYSSGTIASYYCPSFHKSEGYEQTLCFNGQWSVPPPNCKRVTLQPESSESSFRDSQCNAIKLRKGYVKYSNEKNNNGQYDSGTVAEMFCNLGYTYVNTKKRFCNKNGRWTGIAGYCRRAR